MALEVKSESQVAVALVETKKMRKERKGVEGGQGLWQGHVC